jgi:hypothetical protein
LTTATSSNIKTVPHRHNKRPVWKKVYRVGDAIVVIIDESIVELLHIDEDCWAEVNIYEGWNIFKNFI